MSERVQSYYKLLDLKYDKAVGSLMEKYGVVKDDYYREESYQRFLKDEIKSIANGKYKRTDEGLYCHHIDENIIENLSSLESIKERKPSFKHQKKERLVYCDLVEHMILHALISEETRGEYSYLGYEGLYTLVKNWYVSGFEPKPIWMKKCKERAYLTFEEADNIILKIENMTYMQQAKTNLLSFDYRYMFYNAGEEFKEKYKTMEEYISYFSVFSTVSSEIKKHREEIEVVREADRIKFIEETENKRRKEVADLLIDLKESGYSYSRQTILEDLYKYGYWKEFGEFKEFRSSKMPIIKEKLVVELMKILEEIDVNGDIFPPLP